MLYPKDPKIAVQKRDRTMSIEWKWKNENGISMTLIGIMLTLSAVMVVVMPEKPGQEMSQGGRLWFYVFMSFALSGLYAYCLSCWLNRTKIRIDRERMIVRTSPFPWFKPVVIDSSSIQQFFIGKSPLGSRKIQTLFVLREGSDVQAIGHYFPSSFAAYQVCHELQDFYGLDDLPVYGQTSLPHQPGPRETK
jgi:hypothetical protein